MIIKKFNTFKKQALKFKVQDNHFFWQKNRNVLIRWLVNSFVERQTIFQQLNNKNSHKGWKTIYC